MKWLFSLILIFNLTTSGYSQKSLVDSIKTASVYENEKELGEILRKAGIGFKNKGEYDHAEECYKASLDIYTVINDSIGISRVLNSLALFFPKKGQNAEALKFFYEAIEINKKIKYVEGLTNNYLNLGNFFFHQNDFSKSLEYYFLCKEKLKEEENKYILASIYLGIGNILSNPDYNNGDLEKAQMEYLSALSIYKQISDSLNVSRVYNNLGTVSYNQQRYDDAINYFTKGLEVKLKINDQKGILIGHYNIGNALLKKKEYSQSLHYYESGKEIAAELGDGVNYLHIISNIVNVYMALGNAELATQLFSEYRELRDSVYTEEKSRQLTELQTLYETEKTAEELEQQKAATEEKAAQNRILIIVIILLVVLAIAVVVLFMQRQRAVKHLKDKEDQLHREEMTRLQKEQDIQSLHAMMEGQEKERKRIAEDLHDRLGAKLSAIKLFHESSRKDLNKFEKVDEMLNETINETREIAHNLAPSTLTKYGLVQALEDLLDTLQLTDKIEAEFSHTNLENRLPEGVETTLYYIVQELVTNTIRHSEADSLSIQLSCHEGGLVNLCYEDNGKGFDPASLPEDSMGLRNMKTRLASFAGKLSIDSAPNRGSTFIVDIALGQISA